MKPTLLVFAGKHYYPAGGMDDLRGAYFNWTSALASFSDEDEWAQVFDTETGVATIFRRGSDGWTGPLTEDEVRPPIW